MRLKSIRNSLGLTQAEVAKLASISDNYYCEIEKEKKEPSYPVAIRIAKALKISPAIFFEKHIAKSEGKAV